MRLQKGVNLAAFLQKVNTCKGTVLFRTSDGDCLNLKSKLTSFIFITLIDLPELLYNSEVECEKADDYQVLSEYLTA